MRYSYESWGASPIDTPQSQPTQPERETHFSFSDDLKELEASLSMNFTEGMSLYQKTIMASRFSSKSTHVVAREQTPDKLSPDEARQWDEMARTVAEHVLQEMQATQSLHRKELNALRQRTEAYYQDNRAMAMQIQRLLAEKEQLQTQLGNCQVELSRYRPVLGNLHLKV